ncbi:hypothetical protein P4313_24135, partial [Bacillus tropicus]|uniref:hypothetical protein n=1 Tax=Bacillus tropicus TaxID=2026188 RepID=UPI002E1D98A7|nr:hypothetical protein [Bacillus tropicus]
NFATEPYNTLLSVAIPMASPYSPKGFSCFPFFFFIQVFIHSLRHAVLGFPMPRQILLFFAYNPT